MLQCCNVSKSEDRPEPEFGDDFSRSEVDPACRVIFARKQTDITFQNRESQENVILSVIVVLSGSQISWKLFTDSILTMTKLKFLLTVFVHLPKWQQCLCHDHYLLKTPSNICIYQKKKNQFSADAMAMSRIWSTKSWLTFPPHKAALLYVSNNKSEAAPQTEGGRQDPSMCNLLYKLKFISRWAQQFS